MPKGKAKNGINKGWFKKNYIVSDETRKKLSEANKGRVVSEETKRKISESKKFEKSVNWKGDKVGYSALHKWVYKKLGKAILCTLCSSIKKVEWANKSHQYKRDITDWIELCRGCHIKYDNRRRDYRGRYI